jgi:hypothetical protein
MPASLAITKPSTILSNPIRRVCHHRIDPAERREHFKTISED